MNKKIGNNTLKYHPKPTSYFCGIVDNVGPTEKKDCFRIRKDLKLSHRYPVELKHGELLADTKYILCDNACADKQEVTGTQLLFYMRSQFKTTFIPWVLARCSILIP